MLIISWLSDKSKCLILRILIVNAITILSISLLNGQENGQIPKAYNIQQKENLVTLPQFKEVDFSIEEIRIAVKKMAELNSQQEVAYKEEAMRMVVALYKYLYIISRKEEPNQRKDQATGMILDMFVDDQRYIENISDNGKKQYFTDFIELVKMGKYPIRDIKSLSVKLSKMECILPENQCFTDLVIKQSDYIIDRMDETIFNGIMHSYFVYKKDYIYGESNASLQVKLGDFILK